MCSINECDRDSVAKGLCLMHYKRLRYRGTTDPQVIFHGKFRTPEHTAWMNMKYRCNKPSTKGYERYGGRGIKVCEQWNSRLGFIAFLNDMGERPTPNHTLERIDNNGNYEPSNCRWATKQEQQNNKRNNRLIEYKGRKQSMSTWARELGLNINTLKTRLNMYHWSEERALSTPVSSRSMVDVRK